MKTCSKCKEAKELTEFYKNHRTADNYTTRCKTCNIERAVEWNRNNPVQKMLNEARNRAHKKGLEYCLEKSDIHIPKTCPLLGIELKWGGTHKDKDNTPSLDRLDNSKGYTPDNIWIISWRANNLKRDATFSEIETLYKNWKEIEEKCNQTIDMFKEAT
jgi:hypothetical protein